MSKSTDEENEKNNQADQLMTEEEVVKACKTTFFLVLVHSLYALFCSFLIFAVLSQSSVHIKNLIPNGMAH